MKRHRSNDPIIFEDNSFPYYGGLQGQVLQLRGQHDGTVNTFLVADPAGQLYHGGAGDHQRGVAAFANTVLTVNGARDTLPDDLAPSAASSSVEATATAFERDFNKIQLAAARLVAIQELAKRQGSLSSDDNKVYADSLLELGVAAQNLAKLQQSGKIKDFSMLLQPHESMPQKQPLPAVSESHDTAESSTGDQKVDEVTEQHFSEMDLLPQNGENPYEDVSDDSVAISAPKKDASVAEAKPVGLSIAGEGGVASSKPNAIALSGRNGLAVASPKATAIAGVSPEEAAAFSVSLPNRNQVVIKATDAAHAAHRVSAATQNLQYDDYDYNDFAAVRPATRDVRLRTSTANSNSNFGVGSDAFVNKWKTIIAEDYASARAAERSAQPPKKPNRFALRSGDAFYIF